MERSRGYVDPLDDFVPEKTLRDFVLLVAVKCHAVLSTWNCGISSENVDKITSSSSSSNQLRRA